MDASQPGSLLDGRYKLRAVLGRGGMGPVWLASDELLHRDVAVKEIVWPSLPDEKERETLRRRALREARMAARLSHPNIIRVYDVVEEGGRPWIVMELARYRSLREVVEEDGPLTPARTAKVGLQIIGAIKAAHAAGVLHRDVKPANVLLGPDDRVLLTDFGTAVSDGSPTLTTAGILIGSPSYMAPERAQGSPGTPAADLWSLGATLYTAVEGRPPFQRDGVMAVLTAIVAMEPDSPQLAGPLWPVISGLLRKDPAERLGAAGAESALRRIAGQSATSAAPAGATSGPAEPAGAAGRPTEPAGATGGPTEPAGATRRPAEPVGGRTAVLDAAAAAAARQAAAGSPAEEPATQRLRHRRLTVATASVVLAAVVAVAIALVFTHAAPRPAASSGHPGVTPTAHPTPSASSHAAGRTPNPAQSGGTSAIALPAGFVWYHDPSGFSIGMPQGWQVSHQGHLVYIQDPASNRFLIVDQTTQPKPDPLADWQQQEAARISTYPGYHRIRLEAVNYPQAEKAADWEFTYYLNGQLTHVLNRNILVNSHQAYALYWSTPESQWAVSYYLFQGFATTFRPVGETNTGS